MGGPFTADQLIDEVNWVLEEGTEEDMEHLEVRDKDFNFFESLLSYMPYQIISG